MQAKLHLLTTKELQVLQLLATGLAYKSIAAELQISPETVKKHVSHIYKKLSVKNRLEALRKVKML